MTARARLDAAGFGLPKGFLIVSQCYTGVDSPSDETKNRGDQQDGAETTKDIAQPSKVSNDRYIVTHFSTTLFFGGETALGPLACSLRLACAESNPVLSLTVRRLRTSSLDSVCQSREASSLAADFLAMTVEP